MEELESCHRLSMRCGSERNTATCAFKGLLPFASARPDFASKGLIPFAAALPTVHSRCLRPSPQHRGTRHNIRLRGAATLRLSKSNDDFECAFEGLKPSASARRDSSGAHDAFKGLIPFASACNRIYVPTLPSRGYSLRLGSSPFYFKRRKPHPDSERRCTQHWRFERRTKALRKASCACLSRNQGARCAK